MGAVFGSLDRDDDVLALGLNRAVDLLAKKLASVRTIGPHPGDKELVTVRKGRFGPYVQHGKTVANLPRGVAMDDITLEEAVALLAEKGKALKPRGAAGARARPPAKAAKPARARPKPRRARPRRRPPPRRRPRRRRERQRKPSRPAKRLPRLRPGRLRSSGFRSAAPGLGFCAGGCRPV